VTALRLQCVCNAVAALLLRDTTTAAMPRWDISRKHKEHAYGILLDTQAQEDAYGILLSLPIRA